MMCLTEIIFAGYAHPEVFCHKNIFVGCFDPEHLFLLCTISLSFAESVLVGILITKMLFVKEKLFLYYRNYFCFVIIERKYFCVTKTIFNRCTVVKRLFLWYKICLSLYLFILHKFICKKNCKKKFIHKLFLYCKTVSTLVGYINHCFGSMHYCIETFLFCTIRLLI